MMVRIVRCDMSALRLQYERSGKREGIAMISTSAKLCYAGTVVRSNSELCRIVHAPRALIDVSRMLISWKRDVHSKPPSVGAVAETDRCAMQLGNAIHDREPKTAAAFLR